MRRLFSLLGVACETFRVLVKAENRQFISCVQMEIINTGSMCQPLAIIAVSLIPSYLWLSRHARPRMRRVPRWDYIKVETLESECIKINSPRRRRSCNPVV